MGSLAGVFNACSTLFTVDFYQKFRPKAAQHEIVRMGRIATGVMVLLAIAWIPVVKGRNSLYEYLQSVQGYLAPPVFVVFYFGIFWKRLNAQGCFWSMMTGFALGLARMIIDTPVAMTSSNATPFVYTKDSFLWIINTIPFQYFSVLITIVCAVVMVVVSYMSAAPDDKKIAGLTFATASEENKSQTRASWGTMEVAASVLVLLCILGAYLYFTG
jgi:SSS family solute:Na+ symporter